MSMSENEIKISVIKMFIQEIKNSDFVFCKTVVKFGIYWCSTRIYIVIFYSSFIQYYNKKKSVPL